MDDLIRPFIFPLNGYTVTMDNASTAGTNMVFEEGKPCPVKVEGGGGGLSFSPNGDMLLVGAFPNPTEAQVESWGGAWRAKLFSEAEFPAIPIFAIGGEEWFLETPCNPAQQEKESPGFAEALYRKEDVRMAAILVDSETGIVRKIAHEPLDEMFIERLVVSWNPFRHGDRYNKTFTAEEFAAKVQEIFRMRRSRELWMSSW